MDRYMPKKVLARTLTGQVILSLDTCTGDWVALKRNVISPTTEETFSVEKRVHETLSNNCGHQHVLRLRDTFVSDGYDHIVMDYCKNGDLFEMVSAAGSLDTALAKRYFGQVASAVAFMHGRGFAHRDLSLENVLLDDQRNCHLCDFGLATKASGARTDFVGKPFYIAPEIVARCTYDPVKADMWSLGVMLFMMLSGAPLCELASPKDARYEYFTNHGLRALIQTWNMSHRFDAEALELLEMMLDPNPKTRARMAQVLVHPYITGRRLQQREARQQKSAPRTFMRRWIDMLPQRAIKLVF
ncbi:unnamed protein product [Aphanomyces euteiches]|uniref:Protein kinase domain-containing protein n=1 Tax=Aphanomyces euteiches TaxID=100861 RepID=A0A6G0WSW2_9STRA|nr:hypothetical protein Ae201684_011966 [Aphanomyces euteiches]KAH9056143.1 hypothetical protein Ae201684P_021880 [Aphanomyces euteiches]KAH9144105.1 hypothetical protein AeRB84_011934 [Aphanomyces euteiches]